MLVERPLRFPYDSSELIYGHKINKVNKLFITVDVNCEKLPNHAYCESQQVSHSSLVILQQSSQCPRSGLQSFHTQERMGACN